MSVIDLGTSVGAAKNPSKVSKIPSSNKAKQDVPMMRMSRRPEERVCGDFNEIDMMEAESSKIAKMEMWIAKALGTKLVATYPNRQWGVQVDVKGGMAIITCPSLSTERGYYLHLRNDTLDALSARAVTAAGEILERFGLSRARRFDSDILETLDRNMKDEVISVDAMPEDI